MTQEQRERQDQAPAADEDVVAREEAAAAAEAGEVGGRRDDHADEAMRPVSEGGGGEAEGFELAEEDLRDEAEYGEPDQRGSVAREDEPPETPGEA